MLSQNLKEEITPRNPRSALKGWGLTAALFYGFGLLVFHAKADFENGNWVHAYYTWQFIKDALFIMVVCSISGFFWKLFSPLLIYSIIRVCLEIISITTGAEANNPLIVTVLFLSAATACVYSSIVLSRQKWS